jgi:predicted DNA-binding transcriptional regulator YafY
MTLAEQIKFVRRLDDIIARKRTGTAHKLAAFMAISRSQLFYYFDTIRSLGAEIAYCKSRKTYYYVNDIRPDF